MSAALYPNPLTIRRPRRLQLLPVSRNGIELSHFCNPRNVRHALHFVAVRRTRCRQHVRALRSGESNDGTPHREVPGELSLDSFLSFAELIFIAPPAVYSLGCVAGMLVPGAVKPFQLNLGNKVFVWQFVLLVCAMVTGTLIRRRQWGRICRESDGVGVDLLARIEKVEEDLRSSATIVRVLSRQLEKLGIRFRVTRKALKEPITETAILAQKNSEATRALALQEDILEKELGETQKVLLAMQEQQQKQLELILAVVKASKVLDSKRDAVAAAIDQDQSGINSVSAKRVNNSNTKHGERKVNNWNPKQDDSAKSTTREPRV